MSEVSFGVLLETVQDVAAAPGQAAPSRPSDDREKDGCRRRIAGLSYAAAVPQDCTKLVNGYANHAGGILKVGMLTLAKA
jgi:hypothetical protein